MAIPAKLKKFLEKNKIKYEAVGHKKVFTAWDSAETQKIKPQTVVKTLVIKLDNEFSLACLPANKNLNKNKLKKVANQARKKAKLKAVKKVDLAREAWMRKNLLGKVGATPPFGSLAGIVTFIDAPLLKNKELLINSGDYEQSLRIKAKDFLKLEPDLIKGNFSEKK